jgi:hypothetical protein
MTPLERLRNADPERLAHAIGSAVWWFTGLVLILVGSYLLWGWAGWLFTLGLYITLGIMFNTLIDVVRR